MRIKVGHLEENLSPADYGQKAYWLSWLHHEGYVVPDALFLPAADMEVCDFDRDVNPEFDFSILLARFRVGDGYRIAVRSSASCEDTEAASFAGHFQTLAGFFTLTEVVNSIRTVFASWKSAQLARSCRMGVILQQFIEANVSGIAFSSNPVTGSKAQILISAAKGRGSEIVSGRVAAEEIVVDKNGPTLTTGEFRTRGLELRHVNEIANACCKIEKKLGMPVDIEWCIDSATRNLYFLQCRPATGILHIGDLVVPVRLEVRDKIPARVITNKKVELRMFAEIHSVPISRAYLVFVNCHNSEPIVPTVELIAPEELGRGFSAVLIYPERLGGKIVRRFTDLASLLDTLTQISRMVASDYWSSTIIVQEIFDPDFTGIVRRVGESLVLDIGRGHFIPKGVVPVSQYLLDLEGRILRSEEVSVDHYFRILNGQVIEQQNPDPHNVLSIPQPVLTRIAQLLSPVLEGEHSMVEFGVLLYEHKEPLVYLIDAVSEIEDSLPDVEMIADGVISRGSITGQFVRLSRPGTGSDSLNFHYHDKHQQTSYAEASMIFLCDLPDISLLDIVRGHDPKKIGFVFREGSILCHLAIVLREKGIPAIRAAAFDQLIEGAAGRLDASTVGTLREKRIQPI